MNTNNISDKELEMVSGGTDAADYAIPDGVEVLFKRGDKVNIYDRDDLSCLIAMGEVTEPHLYIDGMVTYKVKLLYGPITIYRENQLKKI